MGKFGKEPAATDEDLVVPGQRTVISYVLLRVRTTSMSSGWRWSTFTPSCQVYRDQASRSARGGPRSAFVLDGVLSVMGPPLASQAGVRNRAPDRVTRTHRRAD